MLLKSGHYRRKMVRILSIALGLGFLANTAIGVRAATTLDGAEIFSNETVKYGRWEIRMQVAATPGSVSTFFTYYNESYLGSPEPWREIDIEIIGKRGNGFQSNLITGFASNRTTSEAFHTSATDLSKGFHTFVLDWTPDSIVYRIDGQNVRKNLGTETQVKALSDLAETYRMNIWASAAAAWAGALDPAKLPIAQVVNWIAYSSYTPGQGPNGSNFTPQWTDDFNTFDTQRWSTGNWSFDGNLADFTPDNALVSNGYLMLILSKKGWTGTVTPPTDPQGNSRTVSIQAQSAMAPFRIEASAGRLRFNAGSRNGQFTLATLDGRLVGHASGSGWLQFDGLSHGLFLLRTPVGNQLVLIP
jgi:endo-1,3-1,4-beta-glycanase ExoK